MGLGGGGEAWLLFGTELTFFIKLENSNDSTDSLEEGLLWRLAGGLAFFGLKDFYSWQLMGRLRLVDELYPDDG